MKKLVIPPIRRNPRRVTKTDAAYVIGNSSLDVDRLETERLPSGDRSVTERRPFGKKRRRKGEDKRQKRQTFVPNKLIRTVLLEWKDKYGALALSGMINVAIEYYYQSRK
jgi:hypothetical protein